MSHWGTLYERSNERMLDCLRETIEKGNFITVSETRKAYNQSHPAEAAFLAYEYPQTPVRFLTLCRTNPAEKTINALSAYPFLKEGMPNIFEVLALNPDESGAEGTVECVSKSGESFTFFDPLFCYNKDELAVGQKYEFGVAAIAYSIEQLENPDIVIDSGPALEAERQRVLKEDPSADISAITSVTFSMTNMRCIIPRDDPGDAEFQTEVEVVEWFDLLDVKVCRMQCLFRDNDDEKWAVSLYASEHVLGGYQPAVGHIVRGVAWIQASVLRAVQSEEESWIDRGGERDAMMDGFMRAFEAREYLADLHPGVRALAGAIIGAGWDVTKYAKSAPDPEVPDLLAEGKDRKVNVWVNAFCPEPENAAVLSDDQKASLERASKERGQEAIFATVKCKEVEDYFYYDFPDQEILRSTFGNLSLVEAQRKTGEGDAVDLDSL